MQQQLVLQFRRTAFESDDGIVALEGKLKQTLGDLVEMDGHDNRARTINIFILAADPGSAFRRVKPVLESAQLLDGVMAAHRVVGGSQFKVIWPLRVRRKFRID